MILTVTSIKQVEHIIEVEFRNLQVFKIFKYFTSTVSSIWLMLHKKQIHVIISKERLEHGKLCIFSSAVTTK